jgi:hypothetical protein
VECKYNQSCEVPFRASGGDGGYSFTLLTDESELPPGLTFDGEGLSGTPAEAGLWEVAFEVDDGSSNYRQASVQVQVLPDPRFQIKTTSLSPMYGLSCPNPGSVFPQVSHWIRVARSSACR